MDPTNIRELLHAFKIELLTYRYWVVILFILTSSLILSAGYFFPKTFTSQVVLYADVTNIIGSLLEGKAEITKIDRAKEARDIIFTERIFRSVATKAGYSDVDTAGAGIRRNLKISSSGDYVNIKFQASSDDRAFNVVNAVTEAFLAETSRKKREESQSAFEFIDAQVESYKKQLEHAEERLKAFSASNIDISEKNVATNVINYKNELQILELEIQDIQARLSSFSAQIEKEPPLLQIEISAGESFKERQLENFEQKLADLRLSYLDTHPDIISLLDQISLLQEQVQLETETSSSNKKFEQVENPTYTNLQTLINNEFAELTAKKQRYENVQSLLLIELSNAESVASKQATYKELTRDYSVTKDVYEDMLKRRESARLSMTLDIQGQGVTYKIHEPPLYPVKWDGFQLIHYALIGPLVGLALPFGLILAMVLFDQKVRSSSFMVDNLPSHVKLMTTIPMYNSAVVEVASKRSLVLLALCLLVYILIYSFFSFNEALIQILGF